MVEAVVVWRARAPTAPGSLDLSALDDAERGRILDASTPVVAGTRATGFLLLRRVVGEVLGQEPAEVLLDRTCQRCGAPHGRPRVTADPALHVSVTHAGVGGTGHNAPVVAVALTRLAPVGVDLVAVSEVDFPGFEAVARHRRDAATTTDESRARLWARKEAAVKALGIGLDLDPVSFPAPTPGTVGRLGPGRVPVSVTDIDLGAGSAEGLPTATTGPPALVGAVALARDDAAVPVHLA